MSPFPNLLHPTHPAGFNSQQNPQQLPTPPLQQQPLHPPQQHRPLRFLAQILSPYDLTHSSLPHPTPYPLHPSNTQHSPTNPLSRTSHRHNHHNILAPDFDVRETERAYFLEGEFPGIKDRESVRLEWVDCRTLAIEAKIVRVELSDEWGDLYFDSGGAASPIKKENRSPREDREMTDVPPDEGECDGGPLCREAELEKRKLAEVHAQMKPAPVVREWLSERRVGHYQRTFTFPADVEAGGVRARLGQGLLRILVPKVRERTAQTKKVEVENVE